MIQGLVKNSQRNQLTQHLHVLLRARQQQKRKPQFNPTTPTSDQHVTSLYMYPYIIQPTGNENTQTHQVRVFVLIKLQILKEMSSSQGENQPSDLGCLKINTHHLYSTHEAFSFFFGRVKSFSSLRSVYRQYYKVAQRHEFYF